MKKCVIYIHGKGGSAAEAEHYKPLFAGFDVIGFDYQAQTPWEAKAEFANFFAEIAAQYEQISLVANSIGAFFALHSFNDKEISEAFFISPIVNMEHLIENIMNFANVTEAELQEKGTIQTEFGETLSWEYLSWVRNNRINRSAKPQSSTICLNTNCAIGDRQIFPKHTNKTLIIFSPIFQAFITYFAPIYNYFVSV